jgi:hypothetical protein
MAFSGIIIGLLLIFAGIWLFAMSVFLNGFEYGLVDAIRFGSPCIGAGFAILGLSYYVIKRK